MKSLKHILELSRVLKVLHKLLTSSASHQRRYYTSLLFSTVRCLLEAQQVSFDLSAHGQHV